MGNKEVAVDMAVVSKGDPMEEGVRVTSGPAEGMGRRGEGAMVAIEKLYINNCRVNINDYIVTRVAKNAPNVLLKITQMLAYIFCVKKRKSEDTKALKMTVYMMPRCLNNKKYKVQILLQPIYCI